MVQIIPVILSDSLSAAQHQLDRIKHETSLTRVQIDIVAPDFIDELTIDPVDVLELQLRDFAIDIHLMTNDPISDVVECSQIPGIHMIIAQVERMRSQIDFVEHVKSYGIKSGLSFDTHTPLELFEQVSQCDGFQVMGVPLGAQGQAFGGDMILERIRFLAAHKNPQMELLVDGGVHIGTAEACVQAGATGLVVGSYLWESQNLSAAIEALL